MTSDSSSFREGLVWAREANGCVSHTCSVPFTAWTRENVSVREEASFSRARSASFRGRASLLRTCFMPLAGYYLSMVDFHVYPMHIAEHTNALNCHQILQAFTVLHHAHGQAADGGDRLRSRRSGRRGSHAVVDEREP